MATPVKDGILEIALSNAAFFTNATQDDFIVRTATSNQNMLLGTLSNAPAALVLTSNNDTLVTQSLGVNTTSPQYTVDVNGNINFTGNLTANGAVLFSQNMSFASNTVNTFAVLPVRQSFQVTGATQSIFDVLGGGTYVATALSTEVYLNGSRLSYVSPSLKDYDLIVSYPNGYSTNYRVTLTTPATTNNVVDIQIWPATPASNALTGIYCSNVDFTSNVTTGSLTVSSNIYVQGSMTMGNATYTNGFFVQLTNSNAITQTAISAIVPNIATTGTGTTIILPSQTSNVAFRVAGSNTPILTVRGDGNVGVGVSNPTYPLHVQGDARIQGNLTVNGTQTVIDTNVATTERLDITNDGTGPALRVTQLGAQPIADFYDDGGVLALRLADGGNVGVGTSNPGSRLAVGGNASVGAAYSNVIGPANGLIVQGNVGVGTSNPQTTLQLYASTYTKPLLVLDVSQSSVGSGMPINIGQPLVQLGNSSYTSSNNQDYYGIGFGYVGDASLTGNKAPAEIGFKKTNNTAGTCGDVVMSTRTSTTQTEIATERLRITSAGNVGIGTSNPQVSLDVYGSVKCSQMLCSGGLNTGNIVVSTFKAKTISGVEIISAVKVEIPNGYYYFSVFVHGFGRNEDGGGSASGYVAIFVVQRLLNGNAVVVRTDLKTNAYYDVTTSLEGSNTSTQYVYFRHWFGGATGMIAGSTVSYYTWSFNTGGYLQPSHITLV